MKLTVDLSNAADVAAALALLHTFSEGGTAPKPAVALAPAPSGPDPAQVFGAAAPAVPLAPTTGNIAAATPVTDAPPPPASFAPATPTNGAASSAAPAPSGEVDSAGVPWSADLHAANKAKCKDGTWKAKRGLTAAPAAPAAAAAPAAPAAAAAPAAPAAAPTTYAQLMPRITAAVTAGILPPAELRVSCESLGVPSIVTLQENASFVPLVWADLCARFPAVATVQG